MEEKKVYLITGGSRGIGRAICIKLASQHNAVLINYKENREKAEETLKLVQQAGGQGALYQCDITDFKAVKQMMENIFTTYKRLDGLVNNAGVLLMRYLMFTKKDDWEKVIQTNLNGAFHCVKCILPQMIQREDGNIINISSVVTQRELEGCVAYTTSKWALNGFTKSLAKEVSKYNIRVNGINCGFIETDMIKDCGKYGIEMEHVGQPEDIAEWVSFLLSEKSHYLTGQIITVDGGVSL